MKRPSLHEIIKREFKQLNRGKSATAVPSRPMAVAIAPSQLPSPINDTDDVGEGSVNFYFTDARAYAFAKAALLEGTDITITADDENLTLTIASTAGTPAAFAASHHYSGFPNRTDTSLSFAPGTLTLTLTASSDTIWIDGVAYTIDTLTKTIPDVTGRYWFWITAPGGVPQLNGSTDAPGNGYGGARAGFDQCLVATVYWNATLGDGRCVDERHWFGRDCWFHEYLHETIGARYHTGFAGSFTDTTFSIADGEFYDEDIEHSFGGAQTTAVVLYLDGSADYTWIENSINVFKASVGGVLQFNNGTTLTDVDVSKYVNNWVFATGDIDEPVHVIVGKAQHATIASARAETLGSLSLGTLASPEYKLLYRVTYRNVAGTPTYIEAADYRSVVNLPVTNYAPTDHNALANLTVGDYHTQYFPADGSRAMTGPITMQDGTVIPKLKLDATAPPEATNDTTEGYGYCSLWADTVGEHLYGCVNPAEGAASWVQLDGGGTADVAAAIHAATEKTDPADDDEFGLADSADSYALKRTTWADIVAALTGAFDLVYAAIAHTHAQLHDRAHDVDGSSDHNASGAADYDKWLHSNESTGAPEWSTLPATSVPLYENTIINGGFTFFQRQIPATATSYADGAYSADRWYVLTTNAVNVQRIAGITTTSPYAVQVTQANASAQRFGLAQVFESIDSLAYRGRDAVFCGQVQCSASTDIRVAILEWTGTADSPTKDVVADWTSATYTAGNFFLASNLTVTAVAEVSVTADTLAPFVVTGEVSTSCNNLYVMVWTESTQAQNVTLKLAECDLFPGTEARTWSPRPAAEEEALCDRYCVAYGSTSTAGTATRAVYIQLAIRRTSNWITLSPHIFPAAMRVTPTLSHNVSGWTAGEPGTTTIGAYDIAAGAWITITGALTVITEGGFGLHARVVRFVAATSFSATQGTMLQASAGPDVRFIFDSELGA